MALDSVHPLYTATREDHTIMTHTYAGERVIKEQNQTYLPFCPSHILDGIKKADDLGYLNYQRYKMQAVFPDYVKEAVLKAIGMMHQKEAVIELPPKMEPMRLRATLQGETLEQLLRRISLEQLVQGRVGILGDLPANPDPANPLPYIALYKEAACRNWDNAGLNATEDALNLVVLDETSQEISADFTWKEVKKYRVLMINDDSASELFASLPKATGQTRVYLAGQFRETTTFDISKMKAPTLRGVSLDEIPFTFINTKDITPDPDDPPFLGLARLSLTIYRGEADYRQNLFMQGQDTLVTIGDELPPEGIPEMGINGAPTRVGAGAKISMELNGDAKYIGVGSEGLGEQRQAITNDRMLAATKTVEIGKETGEVESGNSRKIRIAAETANLMSVALTGAAGLEKVLKSIAKWMGEDPAKVKVTPNLEFASAEVDAQMMVGMTTAKMQGLPLSLKSMHTYMKERGMTKLTYEQELAEIGSEVSLVMDLGTGSESSE